MYKLAYTTVASLRPRPQLVLVLQASLEADFSWYMQLQQRPHKPTQTSYDGPISLAASPPRSPKPKPKPPPDPLNVTQVLRSSIIKTAEPFALGCRLKQLRSLSDIPQPVWPKLSTSVDASTRPPDSVNPDKFVECLRSLQSTLEACREVDFPLLTCAISCVLNCSRLLHQTELEAALHVYQQNHGHTPVSSIFGFSRPWQEEFDLFNLDKLGFVSFRLESMSALLRSVRIRGIDTSHKTIAEICLVQLKAGGYVETAKHDERLSRLYPAFLTYAFENWQYHCRAAAKVSMAMAMLSSTIDCDLHSSYLGDDRDLEREGLTKRIKDMSLADVEEDWAFIEQNG